MTESAERKFPEWLKRAHLEKIAEGRLAKGTLAWILDVDEDELEVEQPAWEELPDAEADLASFLE